ncbi:MAG: DUF5666 domain-containing protein [Deltaproteobacteria bacterium]
MNLSRPAPTAVCLVLLLTLAHALFGAQALAKDGIIELSGIVQNMPAAGLIGDWTIAGQNVRTDASTSIDQQSGPLTVGAIVEVKAIAQPVGAPLAQSIEVKQAAASAGAPGGGGGGGIDDGAAHEAQVSGAIEALPASGTSGTWTVAGRQVLVVDATVIRLDGGVVAVGAIVEVHGTVDASGAVIASDVEVKTSTTGTTGAVVSGGIVEVLGTIGAVPSGGLLGTWTVAGLTFTVDASTKLDSEQGAFVVGATVEVHAVKQSDGSLLARAIETKTGQGAPEPDARFWGHVVALPPAGPVGIWRIDDKLVDVSAPTAIHLDHGPIAVGAIVEVQGWTQADGVIAAKEIETQAAIGALPGQGPVAVEFRNQRLGHFFMTALTSEIAALDAGSDWQRTGESFKVGGSQAACRFYGMPPRGPDSHFFTVDAGECQAVMANMPAWTFEGHVFSITAPDAGGRCPAGLVPVHRLYNMPSRVDDVNHRYTVTPAALAATLAMGWVDEGVVMCAHP